jgi:UDP-N-acetylglucosamine diphosphorylase/glucosamine-1-phosphate N-acetyltransferase
VAVNELRGLGGEVLLVNGRCPLAHAEIAGLSAGGVLVEGEGGALVACVVDGRDVGRVLREGRAGGATHALAGTVLMSRAWHVKAFRDAALDADLADLIADGRGASSSLKNACVVPGAAVHVHPTATVYPGVILDAEHGPIYVDEGATLRPACTVIGPAYIGAHSTVLDRAVIRGHTAIGPWCKVAGEIGGTIFQGYANKAHDGYLGDSWVGEWSNFGAGTTNSNLLNTYGEIVAKATPGGSNERTGQQFLGCIVGDHVKFAICTRIMTGSVVHTGTMWAAGKAVSGCVAPFSWATDEGVKSFRLEKFTEIARTVMGRRKVTASEGYLARLGELHALVVQ